MICMCLWRTKQNYMAMFLKLLGNKIWLALALILLSECMECNIFWSPNHDHMNGPLWRWRKALHSVFFWGSCKTKLRLWRLKVMANMSVHHPKCFQWQLFGQSSYADMHMHTGLSSSDRSCGGLFLTAKGKMRRNLWWMAILLSWLKQFKGACKMSILWCFPPP